MTTDFIKDIEPFFHRRRMIYVDVGAHKGVTFRQFAASELAIREAHLIEPNPRSFAILERTVKATHGVKLQFCHNVALGDAEGALRMRDADSMSRVIAEPSPVPATAGSDVEPEPRPEPGLDAAPEPAAQHVFEVRATTLDALSAEFERRHVSLLKIDVEGYELQVLAGAEGLLRDEAIDMILIEAGARPEGEQQSYYRKIEDALGKHGYKLFRLYGQMHEWPEDSPLLRRFDMAFMSARFAAENPYRLSRELFEVQKERTELGGKVKQLERQLAVETSRRATEGAEAEVRINRLKTAHERETAEREAAAKTAHERQTAERDAALEQARQRVAALEADLEAAEAERRAGDQERQRLRVDLETLQTYVRQLEKKHVDMIESTSWRALEPARRLARVVTRRKPAKPFAPRLLNAQPTTAPATAPLRVRTPSPAASPIAPLLDKNLYINKINDIIHTRAGGGREFIPFDIVKAATQAQAADSRSRFVFGVPLASRQTSADWDHTLRLLEQTLASAIGQSDPDWTLIVAGHEFPDTPAMADPRIEFVSIDRPPPNGKNKFRADKSAKRHALGRRLAQMGGGYFMQLDADDLVRDDLVATVRSGGYPTGGVSAKGYALDYVNRRLAPVPGVWRQDLHNVCGSCSVVYYEPEHLPTMAHKNNDQSLVFNMTRQHAYTAVVMEELGRPLEVFAEPMVVYLVNHAQSLSFSLQKSGSRGDYIVEALERHALDRDEAAAILTRFGLRDYL